MRNVQAWKRGVVLLACFVATSASAQGLSAVPTTMTPIYFGSAAQLNMMNSVRRSQEIAQRGSGGGSASSTSPSSSGSRWSGGSSAPVSSVADFSVGDDREITAEVRSTFLRGLVEHSGQTTADAIGARLGDIRESFSSRVAAPYGLRADDFADVMTAYTVIMWTAANREVDLPTVNQMQGVRRQMRAFLANRPESPEQRQLQAETMMYQICMAMMLHEQATTQHKPELLDAMGAELEKSLVQISGLRQLALTDSGLGPR